MHRLTVALLAAVDSAVAAAVGLAAVLAPLSLLWMAGIAAPDWGALWPASASVWQLGHLVPLTLDLPAVYLAGAGLSEDAASFTVSLAPLVFAGFTAFLGARSGIRSSRAESWGTGAASGFVVFAAIAAAVALTSVNAVAVVDTAGAVLIPALVYAVPMLAAAVVTEWREAAEGIVADVRDRAEGAPGWSEVPGEIARGVAITLAALLATGALVLALAITLRIGEMLALFQSTHVDALGAVVLTLGQLAYLPTAVVWGAAFVAGPGVALGAGATVAPGGTTVGVLPGIPLLAAVPETTSTWLLLLTLVPVAAGAFAGWIARSRLAASGPDAEHWVPRLAVAAGIALGAAAGAAVLAWAASGAIGPGRLAEVGPAPGVLALAVGAEVLVGAAILLLSPRGALMWFAGDPDEVGERVLRDAERHETSDLGPREERPAPPVD